MVDFYYFRGPVSGMKFMSKCESQNECRGPFKEVMRVVSSENDWVYGKESCDCDYSMSGSLHAGRMLNSQWALQTT